ncbi:ArnT family glycosyltransferase [Halomarina salina]|uniref:ArnT family glycosyltransferase n=1 Tax=Halomarina salina TaxID=1872699 RepID=A0ABD5RMI3_9EURY|nr:glycosyltransferase family 39 protein [Halomarina salina]
MSGRSPDDDGDDGYRSRGLSTEAFRSSLDHLDRGHLASVVLAAVGAILSLFVASTLFPYLSVNHDEGVYLQQADLLLHGRLFLRPPVEESFRPWFFVDGAEGLYSKYAPVPAAVFALGRLLGGYSLATAAISASLVAGVVALGRELFDTRVGVLAGVLLLGTPLFVVHAGLFLPYALTTTLNVAFAVWYLRGERRESVRDAALAGLAVGVAFFARPYTAVLFALPFVGHALATAVRSRVWRVQTDTSQSETRGLLVRRIVTATIGSVGVLVALGYNAVVTGDPFVFPYLAFAPTDGVGFGRHALLGHAVDYTPELALRANALVLRDLFAEWVVAGPLGTVTAAVGLLLVFVVGVHGSSGVEGGGDRVRPALLAATYLTVAGGNVAFWGNYNVLGSLASDTDGLVHYLGPYYHYDLVVPTAVFAAVAVVAAVEWLRETVPAWLARRDGVGADRAPQVVVAILVVGAVVASGVGAAVVGARVAPNAGVTEEYSAGYAPFDDGPPEESVVFLPATYGPWLNHPFQALRNDAAYDGRAVYALGDTRELDVASRFGDRDLYRYVYTGTWVPTDDSTVRATLVPVDRLAGERLAVNATLARPATVTGTTVRLATDRGSAYLVGTDAGGSLSLSVVVEDGTVSVTGPTLEPTGSDGSVALDESDEVHVEVFVDTGPTGGYSYEVTFPVESRGGTHRALSPTAERCPVPDRCVPVALDDSGPDRGTNATVSDGSARR